MSEPIELRDNSEVKEHRALCKDIQYHINRRKIPVYLLDPSGQDGAQREGRPPEVFQYREDGTYAVGNYIGILEYHANGTVERVTINARGPGFGDDEKSRNQQGKFLLLSMLEECMDIPRHVLRQRTEARSGELYSELLCARLAAQLDRAWKKGALRFYRAFPRRDSNVRGRLDIVRELREGMGLRDGRMAYEFREFTEDNDYNRLFLGACLEAERQHPELMLSMRRLLPGYNNARQALLTSSWGRLSANTLLGRTWKRITNPIYREYEDLRVIARAVLLRREAELLDDADPFVTGILIDLSRLWEQYLLKKVLTVTDGRQYQAEESILGHLDVCPDFLWKKEGVVLDAKYKLQWAKTMGSGQSWQGEAIHRDAYQVLSYMLGLTCTKGGVIFPVDKESFLKDCGAVSMEALTAEHLRVRAGQWKVNPSDSFAFWRFPFAVPSESSDYNVFWQAMNREAERLSRQIENLLFQNKPQGE